MISTAALLTLFTVATNTYKLPEGLLPALCYVESTHNPSAVHEDDGGDDSLGICQIQYKTALFLKFKGSKQDLMRPKINIMLAAKYLKYQLKRYHGDVYKAVVAYNAGSFIKSKKTLTAVNNSYYVKVSIAWAK